MWLVVVSKGQAHFTVTDGTRYHGRDSSGFLQEGHSGVLSVKLLFHALLQRLSLLLKRFPWMLSVMVTPQIGAQAVSEGQVEETKKNSTKG